MRRRALLGLTAGAVAAGALSPVDPWLLSAKAVGPTDHATILLNLRAGYVGTEESNRYLETRERTDVLVKGARTKITALRKRGADEIFRGLPLGESEVNLASTFGQLADIAMVTRMPGAPTDLLNNLDLQLELLDAFALIHQRWFGDQDAGYYGNWYQWEIGMPNHIGRAFACLAEVIHDHRPGLLATYVASMDAYLRNGTNGDVNLASRFHTGANLADITTNRIIQGALLGNDERIAKAVTDQLTVYQTIDPENLVNGVTDGFYRDASFIQHDSVAYTGSYGKMLLQRSVQMIRILDGTGWSQREQLVPVVHGWIARGFAPVIFEGWMMEIVKGRGVSRTTTGYADVVGVIEATVDLAALSLPEPGRELGGWVKHVASQSKVPITAESLSSPVAIVRYLQLVHDPNLAEVNILGTQTTVAFNSMERNVHVRDGWSFSLARNSSRISKYEYMSGENLLPWFQGEGAHYLYLSGQDQRLAYGVDHFTCVPAYALAGVIAPTVEQETVPEAYDGALWYENPAAGFTSSSEKQNEYIYFPVGTQDYSGGATLDRFAAVGMVLSDDVTWRDRRAGRIPSEIVAQPNARANRSWFLLDDEIVMLASGISDSPDLTRPRAVRSTIDTRLAEPTDTVEVLGRRRDGRTAAAGTYSDLQWALWRNHTQGQSVGYVFLSQVAATLDVERRTASRRTIRTGNPDTIAVKDVFGVSLSHRRGGVESYAVALVPRATEEQLTAVPSKVKVLANTTAAHAVRHTGLGVTMINTFADRPTQVGPVVLDGAASVILKEDGDQVHLSLADPTFGRSTIVLEIRGAGWSMADADRVTAVPIPGGVRLECDTAALQGASVTATLRRS